MPLKAKKPEPVNKRFKSFWYGDSGVGKTILAISFPNSYIIDTEHGTDQYYDIINANNSVVLHTSDIDEIRHELKSLTTEQHGYSNLIIDSITGVYNSCQEKWNNVFAKYSKNEKEAELQDFGFRYWGKVKADFKTLHNNLLRLNMNVIITAHEKTEYGNGMTKLGVTYDSMRDDKYIYDYVFRMTKNGGNTRKMITDKERAEPNKRKFPDEFEASYQKFLEYYGTVLEKKPEPIQLATEEQLAELNKMIEILNTPQENIDKWLVKEKVDSLDEMTAEQIQVYIDAGKKKIKELESK